MAVKVAVVLAAPTVTEVGTLSPPRLLDSATVAPPVCETVTVQVDVAAEPRLEGAQLSPLKVGKGSVAAVKIPPDPVTDNADPSAVAPNVFVTLIVVLATPVAIVTLTTATTPFCITVVFRPASRQA